MFLYALGPAKKSGFILKQLYERAFCSLALDREVKYEIGRVQQEMVLQRRDPESRFFQMKVESMFLADDFGNTLGTRESVARITPNDIRAYLSERLTPADGCLILCGNLPANYLEKAASIFGKPSAPVTSPTVQPVRTHWDTPRGLKKNSISKVFPGFLGYDVNVAFPAPAACTPDHLVMKILQSMLVRGGPSSMTGEKLQRDLGATYKVTINQFRSYHTGYNVINYVTSDFSYVEKGVTALRLILKNLRRHPDFLARFEQAVTNHVADIRAIKDEPLRFGDSARFNWIYSGKVLLPEQEIKLVQQVTPKDVITAATRYYDWNKRFLVVTGEKIPVGKSIKDL